MGVILTNADVDHTAGLINLRESQKFNLYGTQRVLDVLNNNSILSSDYFFSFFTMFASGHKVVMLFPSDPNVRTTHL